jgi:hypothetical protein
MHLKPKVDILCFDYHSKGRDVNITEPLLYLFEKDGYSTQRCWAFGLYALDLIKYRPKAVLIANGVGSKEQFRIVKLAKSFGCKVIQLTSEGDFLDKPSSVEQFFWGWNEDRVLYCDILLLWSERVRGYVSKYISDIDQSLVQVGGGVGFDRYIFGEFQGKEKLLKKYNKAGYDKVIGLAGWGFYRLDEKSLGYNQEAIDRHWKKEEQSALRESRDPLREIYKQLVHSFPDTLFVIKLHPVERSIEDSEFAWIKDAKNILVLWKEETIEDVISACDLWIGFESTTCLEAWLMGRTTFLINPITSSFNRSQISQGSPIFSNFEEAKNGVVEFFKTSQIKAFEELLVTRESIIRAIIHGVDGKNHYRSYKSIRKSINLQPSHSSNLDVFKVYLNHFLKKIKYSILYLSAATPLSRLTSIKEHLEAHKKMNALWSNDEREEQRRKYKQWLDKFYANEL